MLDNLFLSVLEISLSSSVVIMLLLFFTPYFNKRYAMKWKYWIWIFLALHLIIPVSGRNMASLFEKMTRTAIVDTVQHEGDGANAHAVTAAPQRIVVEIPSQMNRPLTENMASYDVTPLTVLEMLWIAGGLLFLAAHLGSYSHYKRQILKECVYIKSPLVLQQLSDLCYELQIKGKVSIVRYTEAASPMMIGFLHPVLVLPEKEYLPEELFFVLKHELVHLKRRDVYWKLLFVTANAVHFFNPVIWRMRKEAILDMELSCDERVVEGADFATRKAYTETLLSMLHQKRGKGSVLTTQFYGGKEIMMRRLKNIIKKTKSKNGFAILIAIAVLTGAAGLFIGCSVAEPEGNPEILAESGDDDFKPDLRQQMQDKEIAEPAEEENADTAILTYLMEGEIEEEYATLFIGDGFSIYIPDDWSLYAPDAWSYIYNEQIQFWVAHFAGQSLEQVQADLAVSDNMSMDSHVSGKIEMEGQEGERITRVRLMEAEDDVWGVFYTYPEEATEGAGARLPVIVDTFALTASDNQTWQSKALRNSFWDFKHDTDMPAGSAFLFTNGLQLILPEEWADNIVMEISYAPGEGNNGDTLTVCEKKNAQAGVGGVLFYLHYIDRDYYAFSKETPYQMFGEYIDRVLGVYEQDGHEYALVFQLPREMNYVEGDEELKKAYEDAFALVNKVQIITENMENFTECGVDDLDWVVYMD